MSAGDSSKKEAAALVRGVVKTIAGMAVTSPREFIKLAAHAGDQLLKGEASQALADTYAFYVNKGEISPEYFDTSKFADLAPEFGRLEHGAYGVDKLNCMRRIFVNLARDNGADSHKKYLLDLALDMSEPEIKVLLTDKQLGDIASREGIQDLTSSGVWLRVVAAKSGLKHDDLVATAEKGLMEKGLVTGRRYSDGSANSFMQSSGRLTTLGQELCELMVLEDDPLLSSADG